jgi:2-amino-4-hydroxy-6-hydroxymethyldihydropteridine diphosphokinase
MSGPEERRVVFSLGSNEGDRLAHLRSAVTGLAGTPGLRVVAVSPVYETAPVGGPPQADYLNLVVVADSGDDPRSLLDRAHALEAAAGRTRDVRWGPRPLDVDLVAVGDLVVDEPDLVVPHLRARERAFVLVPWCDADPSAVLPGAGRVADLVELLDASDIRRRPDLDVVVPP